MQVFAASAYVTIPSSFTPPDSESPVSLQAALKWTIPSSFTVPSSITPPDSESPVFSLQVALQMVMVMLASD
jgi:hypothetical protein